MFNSIEQVVYELIRSVDTYSCLDKMKEFFTPNVVEVAKNEYFKIKKNQSTRWNNAMNFGLYLHEDLREIDANQNYYVEYRGVVCLEKSTKSWRNFKRKYCFKCWNECEIKFKEQCDGVNVHIWDEKKKKILKNMNGSEIIKSPKDHLCFKCSKFTVVVRHSQLIEDCGCYFCIQLDDYIF